IALTLLAAVGAVALFRYFARPSRGFAYTVAAIITIVGMAEATSFVRAYFGDRSPVKYIAFAADLVEACRWMKPRLDQYDAIFVTGNAISHPYIYTLVITQYAPQRWFADPKTFIDGPLPNGWFRYEQVCLRYGKLHFMFPDDVNDGELERMKNDGKPQRVLMIVRPGEVFGLTVPPPLMRSQDANGRETLWVSETTVYRSSAPARSGSSSPSPSSRPASTTCNSTRGRSAQQSSGIRRRCSSTRAPTASRLP